MKFILKLSLVLSFLFVSSICQAKSGIEASCSVDVWRWGEIPQYIQELDAFPDFIPLTGYVIRTELHYKRTWYLDEDYPGNVESSTVLHNEYANTYEFPYTYWLDGHSSNYTEWIYDDSHTPPRTIAQIDHYDGYYIGCGTLNTVDKHVFRKRFYIANASTPPHDTSDPEEMFNLYDGFDEDVILIEGLPTISPDSCGVSFVDTPDSTWYKWIPTAPVYEGDKPDTLKLNFKVQSEDKDAFYRLRARLYNISWFPGRWTNDFEQGMNQHTPGIQWPDSSGTVGMSCGEEKWVDIELEPSKNPKWSLYFNNVDEGMSSWYELSYNDSVRNGDQVSLTITSWDFGAHSRLCAGLTDWNDRIYSEYEAMPIYNRTNDDSASYFLPIPRDEEVLTYTYPDTIKEHAGEKVIHSTGDWLADAWEEKYVNFSSNMTPDISFGGFDASGNPDSTIYRNINACKTFADDSHIIKSIFPDSTLDIIKDAGDGFRNFEKYRGFYGITDNDGNSINFTRLSPHIRNVFIVPFDNITPADSICSDPRGFSTEYADNIGVQTNGNKPWVRGYPLMQNSGNDLNDISQSEYYCRAERNKRRDKTYALQAHSLIINNILYGIPEQEPVVAIWCNQVLNSDEALRNYVDDFIQDTIDSTYIADLDTVDWEKDHPLGTTVWEFLGSDSLAHSQKINIPNQVSICYTYAKVIENLVQARIDSSYIGYTPANKKSITEKYESIVFGHELGHFMSMKHDSTGVVSLMKEGVNIEFYLLQKHYSENNYKYFRLAK